MKIVNELKTTFKERYPAGAYKTYNEMSALSAQQKKDLERAGVLGLNPATRHKFYSQVVPLLDEKERGVLALQGEASDSVMVQLNYPYEQFRYMVNGNGPTIADSIERMATAMESS